jgi:tRNA/tmRNA/rRNA uracil-C5-methylase (TrmA/RlmC/RlmD family)
VELSENLAADQRAMQIEARGAALTTTVLESLLGADIVSLTLSTDTGLRLHAGAERIADPLAAITSGRASGELLRAGGSFFQANRFLVPSLVGAVMDSVLPDGGVIDLYAGVGLFSMALAGAGRSGIIAVEGQRGSGTDLGVNAASMASRITPVIAPVEAYVARNRRLPPTAIVDPPRTGLSKEVLHALVTSRPRRIVYVSCDPPTMARDARGLLDGGYTLAGIRAFDLFPNTPHVEALAVFDSGAV